MVLVLLLLLFQVILCSGFNHQDLVELENHLLQNYTKRFRPSSKQSATTMVELEMTMHSIQSYDIRTGDVNVYAVVRLFWYDEYLTWNSSDFGGVYQYTPEEDAIWRPDISQMNSNDPRILQSSDAKAQTVLADGSVFEITYGMFNTKCDTDITKYPFDEHECVFTFVSSLHVGELFLNHSEEMDLGQYVQNEEWYLLDPTPINSVAGQYCLVEIRFTIRRRPLFLVIHLIVPNLLISWLNLLTCLIPPDSGERVSFAAALFLSFTFVMSAVSTDLPKNSLNLSVSSLFLLMANCLSAACICWSIFIIRLSKLTEKTRIPNFLRHICTVCKYGSTKNKVENEDERVDGRIMTVSEVAILEANEGPVEIPKATYEKDGIAFSKESAIEDSRQEVTWQDIVWVLDTVFSIIAFLYLVLITSTFFIMTL